MPLPGMRWRHIIINTHSTWLHGDRRGFRSRDHRIHSSGDYKNPPVQGEHAGLHKYRLKQSASPTTFEREAYAKVGEAIVQNIVKSQFRLGAVAVNATHVHALVELPDEPDQIKEIVGWFKWFATRALRRTFPEYGGVEVWAEGETYKAVDNPQHMQSTERYILGKQGTDAWTCSARTVSNGDRMEPGRHDPA